MEGEWNNEDQTHQISAYSVHCFWVGKFQAKVKYMLLDFFVYTWLMNWALFSRFCTTYFLLVRVFILGLVKASLRYSSSTSPNMIAHTLCYLNSGKMTPWKMKYSFHREVDMVTEDWKNTT